MTLSGKYTINGLDLYDLRNESEVLVAQCMREQLEAEPDKRGLRQKDLQDVYALSLNQIPTCYDRFSGHLPPPKDQVRAVVQAAFVKVINNPKD